jgi:OmcA/MtrC family decaheme c-type cytochrome
MRNAALALAAVVAVAGCSGSDGKNGASGADGTNGTNGQDLVAQAKPESCAVCHAGAGATHQGIYNQYTDASKLVASIVSVVSTAKGTVPETYDVTVTFTLTKNGAPYDATITGFAQKTVYVTQYDTTAKTFGPSTSLSNLASLGGGTYTAKNHAVDADPTKVVVAPFAPESSNAMVYAYFAENPTLIPVKGNYKLYDNVASVAQTFGTLDYVSTANVSACEKCHGTPYMKHGYRAGKVAGLPDLVACKACHYDTRSGHDTGWQLLADDPAAFAAQAGTPTAAQETLYAYKANLMNDTHMSHAMEFAYPQTMANCATCHEGKLTSVLTAANFTIATCKSCHPVKGPALAKDVDAKRAPALVTIMPLAAHSDFGADAAAIATSLYAGTGPACNTCHSDSSSRKFSALHTGYDKLIYADAAGAKYATTVTASITSASFVSATNLLTVNFSMTGANAAALIKPTVVISLYGYDTKDFVVSGHSSQADGTTNLEYTEGAMQRSNPTLSSNSPRLVVTPTMTAGNTSWTAKADLTLWAAKLANGSVKRVEIGFLPAVGLDQTVAPQGDAKKAGYNPLVAVTGVTKTFDLVGNALVADATAYGRAIVDTGKCNKCHDALGISFHGANYGSAGVVACRLCHTVASGGSHLEMQSRSIDSYVHAIHSMQPFDIGSINFADPVAALRYNHHIESTYPNFTTLSCESCHNAGTYEVPDQSKSLPSVLSKASSSATLDRTIGAIPSYVTGPGSRACGSCHRAEMINEDAASNLAAFNSHTEAFGYMLDATTSSSSVFDAAVAKIMSFFK